jgi:adenylosuccinate lyase
LADLAPNTVAYLGQVAYFELAVFETLSRAVSEAPTLGSKERLSAVAGDALAKHHGIVAELRALKVAPAAAMEPFADSIDRFKELTRGKGISREALREFIGTLAIPEDARQLLLDMTPGSYIGKAEELARRIRNA